jgi:pilus assembly protein CpaE
VPAVAVAILTEDSSRIPAIQGSLESTALAQPVYSHAGFPASPTDPILRQIQDLRAEVVVVDVEPRNPDRAVLAIELLRATTSNVAIFALGEMSQPLAIVSAMRAGACEYLDRGASSLVLLEAFTRYTTTRQQQRRAAGRARVFTFLNAKAGSGATTLAVNVACALQRSQGSVALVDYAPLGHAQLQLNVRPNFGLSDAIQNLHRLDGSLLESLMTPCDGGLHLLAGPPQPVPTLPTPAELARLFDFLVSCYRTVIIDCSSRMDPSVKLVSDLSDRVVLVGQNDLVSLWSASRVQAFLTDGAQLDKVGLVLNRHRKIPGFSDEDTAKATGCKVLWKVPNQYQATAPAIERGQPFVWQENLEVSRSIRGLAALLSQVPGGPDAPGGSGPSKDGVLRRLLVSPLRAGGN